MFAIWMLPGFVDFFSFVFLDVDKITRIPCRMTVNALANQRTEPPSEYLFMRSVNVSKEPLSPNTQMLKGSY